VYYYLSAGSRPRFIDVVEAGGQCLMPIAGVVIYFYRIVSENTRSLGYCEI
jgi:hypothetical protein